MTIDIKLANLKDTIKRLGSVLVAYSGGLDSSFLLRIAKDCLGENVLAITANSETYTREELEFAKKFCKIIKVRHSIIKTNELKDKRFKVNSNQRCYFCKKELFKKLQDIAKKEGINYVVDASNASDRGDFRPGAKAKLEFNVRSPLDEAGITKDEIRLLSKRFGLSTWNKPQMACLASRIPYGHSITKDRLRKVNKAEASLRKNRRLKGNIRVRDYGNLARIEVDEENIPLLIKGNGFVNRLRRFGFKYVTVDLDGYRTGSMNVK